ncbi:MAG: alginate lyase family protein [Candidatus Omnitrophica bacterium]|nr:alginate lyase family protein [Candidatus Nanoarchaeia archaeon]MDD5551267.1 alginate lyase family protein [Candidatus Omnitrophota bacterium]
MNHEGILFNNREINRARNYLSDIKKRIAYKQLKKTTDKLLKYEFKKIKNPLSIPKFYRDKIKWENAIYPLEMLSRTMISCANMYRIKKDKKYLNKIINLIKKWGDGISGYKTEQARFESVWNFQIMTLACELVCNNIPKDVLAPFFEWNYRECIKLLKSNNRKNNLLYWLGAYLITTAITKEDKKLLKKACQIYKDAIKNDITYQGDMPKETIRKSRGIHYTFFAIDALVYIAEAAKHQGIDLFSYKFKGKSLFTAIDYILPFVKYPETWIWSKKTQDFSVFPYIHSGWCEIVHRYKKTIALQEFLKKYRPVFDSRIGGAQTLFHFY